VQAHPNPCINVPLEILCVWSAFSQAHLEKGAIAPLLKCSSEPMHDYFAQTFTYGQLSAKRLLRMVSSKPRDFYIWSALSQETFTSGQLSAKRLLRMVNSQPRDFYVWSTLSQETFTYGQLSAKRLLRMVSSQPKDFNVWSALSQETFYVWSTLS